MKAIPRHVPSAELFPALFLGGSFFVGAVFGCLLAALASADIAAQLQEYLADYMSLVSEHLVSWSALRAFWDHLRWVLGCVLFSLSVVGVVALPVLFSVRGFLFAFGIACFVRAFGSIGILPALVLFGLPALFWAPGLFLTGVAGVSGSYAFLRRRFGDQTAPSGVATGFWYRVAFSVMLLALCVLIECSLLPVLLPAAARILG